ncbi:ATP-dependent DNA helicase RecG [Seinonella peptonophila]|uniref:ATP-dependent DNA helicase RecG n=1 Tax=Seinonella peptonophila TaxID=112248 RepID=A0A1M4UUR9_9BACL|nr:ATP-dependent DNA helicase RecG [Seinonella peptonophila]SHE60452.1 ATP-dependent DNA helicase RecG [Seinonella peptonophila]
MSQLEKMQLRELPEITNRQIEQLQQLQINSIWDLLTYFPFRYEDMRLSDLSQAVEDEKVAIQGMIVGQPSLRWLGKKKSRLVARCQVDGLTVQLVWFNQHFLKDKLTDGKEIAVAGRWDRERLQITVSRTLLSKAEQEKFLGQFEPIYSLSQSIKMKTIRKLVYQAFVHFGREIEEILPAEICVQYHFLSRAKAMYLLHFPRSREELYQARRRMIYEELFLYECKIFWLKETNQQQLKGIQHQIPMKQIDHLTESLPFPLTKAQKRVMEEIISDLRANTPMNRLLQGDVGSGKTVIAAIALYAVWLSGYQGALMVPTEILAEQHAKSLRQMLETHGLKVVSLVGGMRTKERRTVLEQIEIGLADVVVGTHALIQESVAFKKLGLVITDEQHRFGVKQRTALREKGFLPDVLCMTATPIPRTLAITYFGEMEVSIIDEMPAGRQPIETHWVKKDHWSKVLTFIKKECKTGRQAYVICPLIEESEKIDLQNAQDVYEQLVTQLAPLRVGLLHGRMHAVEKEEVMEAFAKNELQVLVSTTVVEVGVNVPNATAMVIYDADRFGLSQLHQLRGRVGRGSHASTCILIADPKTETGVGRMKIMTETNDGFVISEEDLSLRGPGDFLGVKQSGLPEFKIADLTMDQQILEYARADAAKWVANVENADASDQSLKRLLASLKTKAQHLD